MIPQPVKGARVWYLRDGVYVCATVVFAGPKLVRLIDVEGRHIRITSGAWGFTFPVFEFATIGKGGR